MELTLPLLGDVMTEGTVTTWFQSDGTYVREGDPLYQVETDKVNLTVDAPESGTLERVVAEGETVPVGAIVGRLTAVSAAAADGPRAASAETTGGQVPSGASGARRLTDDQLVAPATSDANASTVDRPVAAGLSEARNAEVSEGMRARSATAGGLASVEVRATPAARALARKLGVDLTRLANGRRLREADILASSRSAAAGQPLTGRRKVIAERMRASLAQTAQLTVSMEVDMTRALELRDQLLQIVAEAGRPTITDLVVRAAVLALREHPAFNATFTDGHLTMHSDVHMGIAVDVDEGLVVPVVKDALQLDLFSLADRTRTIAARARSNTLHAEDVQGATFTVTSLGPLGVDFFTPILNPPQVAILGIGRVFKKLVLETGSVAERQMLYLNLSFDHQVVDGAPAARFLQSVKRFLELPAALLVPTGA